MYANGRYWEAKPRGSWVIAGARQKKGCFGVPGYEYFNRVVDYYQPRTIMGETRRHDVDAKKSIKTDTIYSLLLF